jgi:hypothetical protein
MAKQKAAKPIQSDGGTLADPQEEGVQRATSAKVVRPENFVTLYANHVRIMLTRWDFFLQFGQIQDAQGSELLLLEQIGIYMSPQHAKAYRDLLDKQVKKYEKQYGAIADVPTG